MGVFSQYACIPDSRNWEKLINRQSHLYPRSGDTRSPFDRDYTRILHSCAFRRLKHKTQVFFNIGNDHICTRMEHVLHVESVSSTIAKKLGLNEDLTRAIAIGHDIGHAPFGHQGEEVIKKLTEKYTGTEYWHEKNGLRFVDKIELLEDPKKIAQNLNLTYAVRDGIVSHCGEIDQNGIIPRSDFIDLNSIEKAAQPSPITWEGCVVKIADRIAYMGRDIEDAERLGFIDDYDSLMLIEMARDDDDGQINTTSIIFKLITDICENSTPSKGIKLSDERNAQLNKIKSFNYEAIYKNRRLEPFKEYSTLILRQIFKLLFSYYDGDATLSNLLVAESKYPQTISAFIKWISVYCSPKFIKKTLPKYLKRLKDFNNEKIYSSLETKELYAQAIIDYISGMTDRYAIEIFNELITL